jgi:multiple sugar transport system permease protein
VPMFFGKPFFIFLLRQFFLGIPKEFSQSAKVDGASVFRIYWQLVLPLSMPVISTVMIFSFILGRSYRGAFILRRGSGWTAGSVQRK